jgi:hypothetical protein
LLRWRSAWPAACREHLSVLAKPARAETLPSGARPISQTKSVGHTLSSTGSGLPGPQTCSGGVGAGRRSLSLLARSAGARWARRGCTSLRVRSARAASPHPTRRSADARTRRMGGGCMRRGPLLRVQTVSSPSRAVRWSVAFFWTDASLAARSLARALAALGARLRFFGLTLRSLRVRSLARWQLSVLGCVFLD